MLRSRMYRLIAVVVLLPLGSCGLPTQAVSDLARARQRWEAGRPAAYDYTLRISCFCGGEITQPVVIVVRDNTVESRKYADTGEIVSEQWNSSFPSIDGLFDLVTSANARNAASLVAAYDASLGYPMSISIDYVANVADDEIAYTVTSFHAR